MIKPYFIYLHRRPDTGMPFYIGRGKTYLPSNPTRRAFVTQDRSSPWKSIVERNDGEYSVEIIEWCNTFEQAKDKEIFYIKLFGRKCHGGTLVNLSDGGDGIDGYKHTPETKAKLAMAWKNNPDRINLLRSDNFNKARLAGVARRGGSMIGKKHSDATKLAYRVKRTGANNSQSKRVIDEATGTTYGCVGDAAKATKQLRSALYAFLSGRRNNPTQMRYADVM